mgnify:CR=1 FL=1
MTVKIVLNDRGTLPDKLADAELQFGPEDGLLSGLKLIGFGIWERRGGTGRHVTFPARQYSVNGERRSFALLRSSDGHTVGGQDRLRDLILEAYDEQVAHGCTAVAMWCAGLEPDEAPVDAVIKVKA